MSVWEVVRLLLTVWGIGPIVFLATIVVLVRGRQKVPVAVVMEEPEHFDLKTLPEGFVDIRRMSNGEKMQRRTFNSKMTMRARKGKSDVDTEMDMFNERAELFDWARCIVNHNLQDADGRQLNFTNPEDVKRVDGRIAEEIGTYIDKVNNFEDDEEVGK